MFVDENNTVNSYSLLKVSSNGIIICNMLNTSNDNEWYPVFAGFFFGLGLLSALNVLVSYSVFINEISIFVKDSYQESE